MLFDASNSHSTANEASEDVEMLEKLGYCRGRGLSLCPSAFWLETRRMSRNSTEIDTYTISISISIYIYSSPWTVSSEVNVILEIN